MDSTTNNSQSTIDAEVGDTHVSDNNSILTQSSSTLLSDTVEKKDTTSKDNQSINHHDVDEVNVQNNNSKAWKDKDKKSKNNRNDNDDQKQKRRKMNDRNIDYSEDNNASIHRGSYAHPDMQKQYNIIPTTIASDTNTNIDINTTTMKRKVAILLGYVGTNYIGFQMNNFQKTIQSELELALYTNQYIQISNFGYPQKYNWSTSGRTDKGVHACAQVISMKIELQQDNEAQQKLSNEELQKLTKREKLLYEQKQHKESLDTVRIKLNKTLPNDIQIFDIVRTTRTFCAKTARDKVRYQYMIPSFLLLSPKQIRIIMDRILDINNDNDDTNNAKNNDTNQNNHDDDDEASTSSSILPTETLSIEQIRQLQKELYSIRVTKEQLQTLQKSLKVYEGTHSFHNFSRRVNADEARASRYIVSFHVEEPIIFDNHNNDTNELSAIEWIPTNVIGQSFLLNQIRKMVCLAVDVTRGCLESQESNQSTINNNNYDGVKFIQNALKKDNNTRLSQAPAQGLFLEMSYYDHYNRKIIQTNPELKTFTNWWSSTNNNDNSSNNDHDEVYQRWNDFRHNVIMKHINQEEYKEGNFITYLYNQEYVFNYPYYYGIHDGKCKR